MKQKVFFLIFLAVVDLLIFAKSCSIQKEDMEYVVEQEATAQFYRIIANQYNQEKLGGTLD